MEDVLVPMGWFVKAKLELLDANINASKLRGFNASLVEQLAAANKRIAMLENRLNGDNELRHIALGLKIPQEEVNNHLMAWVRAGKPGLNR